MPQIRQDTPPYNSPTASSSGAASRRDLHGPRHPSFDARSAELAARRGFAELFRDVGFRVKAGDALVVTGPNGTGKTTLLRMLAGLSAPAAGEIHWNGRRVEPFSAECARSSPMPAICRR